MASVCNICTEHNAMKKIQCLYCENEACETCHQKYFNNTALECMFCRVPFSDIFLRQSFSTNFVDKKLKQIIKKNLMDKNFKSQLSLQKLIQIKQLKKKSLQKKRTIKDKIKTYKSIETSYNDIIKNCDKAYLAFSISDVNDDIIQFSCSKNECKGLVVNDQCGVCQVRYCKFCREEEKVSHSCDQNIVDNVSFIVQDTKACPNCGNQIFKIEGCNQMHCVSCRICFDWDTLKVETAFYHNPHYLKWRSENIEQSDDLRNRDVQLHRSQLDYLLFLPCMNKFTFPLYSPFRKDTFLNALKSVNDHLQLLISKKKSKKNQKEYMISYLTNENNRNKTEKLVYNFNKRNEHRKEVDKYKKRFVYNFYSLWNNMTEQNCRKTLRQLKNNVTQYRQSVKQLNNIYNFTNKIHQQAFYIESFLFSIL